MYSFVNVHKRYGLRTVALRKLNLDIRQREFFVLYGPAGAGKSTILNLIAGTTKPTSGDLLRNGHSIVHLPPERRGAAMAFENYALYSHLSVAENLAFPLRAQGIVKAEVEERVRKIASVLGIGHVLERRPGFLSGGQRQRVALGRAIIRPADIYLLDEPIGHLDAKLRHKMRAELKALAEDMHATVLFTTTSNKEALALGDRVGVLNSGRLEQVGTPHELYHKPANTFVGSFIGDPPMSFISVSVEVDQGNCKLRTADGRIIGRMDTPPPTNATLKLGIRPNAITLSDTEMPETIPGRIDVIEHLGHSKIAVISAGKDNISVSLPAASPARIGDKVWMAVNSSGYHVFANETAIQRGIN
ncbi:MAG: ABC transporter ATP-binding protein [Alphaproteobacteria bacterium]|nr:ABC transporter ATP-binding protein [Alphaproteobacteria bacterium]